MNTLNQLRADAARLAPEAIALRRAIHRHPEMGNEEFATSALIADALTKLGWKVDRPVGTAVMATLTGARPGRTVAFRADMDALRIEEAGDCPFASEVPGVMHACGHDFHCAGLLGAAMLLTERRDALRGSVRLLFQPDEEGRGGAQRMIDAGCLEHPTVDAVFGAHVDPDLPAGHVGIKYGKMYAASDMFRVTVHGAGCHGASPDRGIDAIAAGAQVICAIQQIVSRRVSPTDSAVVSAGTFHAGSQPNAIADTAVIEGILRTLGEDTRRSVRAMFRDAVNGACAAAGARADIEITESYPGIVNHDAMTDLARAAAREVLGDDAVHLLSAPTMGTEDFGCLIRDVPGTFYLIGVRKPGAERVSPLHSAGFCPDESAMAALMALHAGIALRFLS